MTSEPYVHDRMRIPHARGLYWVIPGAVDFAIRVFLHRRGANLDDRTIEITATGKKLSAAGALLAGWEWYEDKPDRDPPDRTLVTMILGERSLRSRSEFNAAAEGIQTVCSAAAAIPCVCRAPAHYLGELEKTKGAPLTSWDRKLAALEFRRQSLDALIEGLQPGELCLPCLARDALRKVAAATQEAT